MVKKVIGSVGVDSGNLLLIDPCYIKYMKNAHNDSNWGKWCEERAKVDFNPQSMNGGIAFCTADGDGSYDVVAEIDDEDRILSITVNFVEEDDNE